MGVITQADIESSGVVGAGGAGFPSHVKLSAQVDTVIINAAECEPLLHKDKEILRRYGDEVLVGLAAAVKLTGAENAVIAVKEKYNDVIASLRSGLSSNMSITPLADAYPAGDEMLLVYDVLGRIVPPGGIPPNVGAVVLNVETALNIASSPAGPVTEKYLTIGGAVAEPVTLRVPLGISLAECVAAAGGPTVEDANYIVGGVMMGQLKTNRDAPVDKTTTGVIVLPSDHVVIRRLKRDWKQVSRIAQSACDQCSFCTELCPRYLLGHPVQPHLAMRALGFNLLSEAGLPGAEFCSQCNLCSMYACPESLDPKEVYAHKKRELAEKGEKWQDPPFNPRRPALHMSGRKAPMGRLISRMGLSGFSNVGPLKEKTITTRKVGIKLKQHVGAVCEPVGRIGQTVSRGELVGSVPSGNGKPALGAPVHSSIDGRIAAVEDNTVWIEKE
ncbi:MAG: 4Fe-4S dicluster domain-containing protein [Planctomycetota bacterium]|nr:4Fe-4S dicluster domain-containing protein [Planctomycetota bacterium]